jgi:hypothetical protein
MSFPHTFLHLGLSTRHCGVYREANIKLYDEFPSTPKLISCLPMLPNMHTLILDLAWSSSDNRAAFRDARFPQVRRLVVTSLDARVLLPCFPQLCAVVSNTRMDMFLCMSLKIMDPHTLDFMGLLDESGKNIEEIEGFAMTSESIKCMFL